VFPLLHFKKNKNQDFLSIKQKTNNREETSSIQSTVKAQGYKLQGQVEMGFSAGDSKKGANLFKVRYLPLSLLAMGFCCVMLMIRRDVLNAILRMLPVEIKSDQSTFPSSLHVGSLGGTRYRAEIAVS
jgi:hypothetical protein